MNIFSRRLFGFGLVSAFVTMALPAFAALMPPVKPRFLGQTTVFKGKRYTCIKGKSKGKTVLIWDSGKAIAIASPSASRTPTPSPSSSPTASREPIVTSKIEIPVAKSSDVPNNSTKSFVAKNRYGNETTYILVRNSENLIAMDATCPHKGCIVGIAPEGLLCPCHSALFDPKNGAVLRGPASYALDRLTVREVDNVIYITD